MGFRSALCVALIGGFIGTGGAVAQEASPAASPEASPVAVPAWIAEVAIDPEGEFEGDSTTVGFIVSDVIEIMAPEFETRPVVQLQVANNTGTDLTAVLLTAPEGFDPAGFTLPVDPGGLPEGVIPVGSFAVPAGEQVTAPFADLPEGTYVLATTNGLSLAFPVLPPTDVEVPDIFATPAS